ncbi:MAG: hypothetical protein AAF658_06290 [Myxococcota bacterium]
MTKWIPASAGMTDTIPLRLGAKKVIPAKAGIQNNPIRVILRG